MTFREIAFDSDEYRAECALRQAVLRAPLGLNLHDEDLSREASQLHFGMFDGGHVLIGCVVAVAQEGRRARIRQMAIAGEHQGRGHGRAVMEQVEAALAKRGMTHFVMHARLSAAGFYEKLGYVRRGPAFTEVGIPHVLMEKRLRGEPPAAPRPGNPHAPAHP